MNLLVEKMMKIIAVIIICIGIVIMKAGTVKSDEMEEVLKNKKLNQNEFQSLVKIRNRSWATAFFGVIVIIIGFASVFI